MKQDIRKIKSIEDWIRYFAENLGWEIDFDEDPDFDEYTYNYSPEELGLREESCAKIQSIDQMKPMTSNQPWGIFCIEFESKRFEITALRRILSALIPRVRRHETEHRVWNMHDLLFICSWGGGNETYLGAAHFEEREGVLPQLKMIYCQPGKEDTHNINTFENRLSLLAWPRDPSDTESWRENWAAAFTTGYRETIHTAAALTKQLAEEARAIRDRIITALSVETEQGYVHKLYAKFKEQLVHDMQEKDFADMYAQTIVYGLFSARCLDDTPETFSAAEAVEKIPNTNPFLKSLLSECLNDNNQSGISFDELEVGNVVDILASIDPKAIVQDFGRQTGGGREDPVLHFYEEFLTEYDKSQKVQRGVFYTPQPVVNFIVRAVDDILKNECGFIDGLASTETKIVEMQVEKAQTGKSGLKTVTEKVEVPAVQVLDPATGTGTFLRQVILQIYENFKLSHRGESEDSIQKAWNEYVPKHLLPRINGFELMMAPYAVAHMKLAMVLKETGYNFDSEKRLQVYLTNTLEESNNSGAQMSLFSDPLAMESVEANQTKNNPGINIIIGNPPYSYTSSNKGSWIRDLVSIYKDGLNEKKIHLDDDYIKFIRYGQYRLEKNNGVLAYISNNSFIDGLTHRVMRKKLLEFFDEIYVINLHGDSKKGEISPDGSKDENVFEIQQGVSINILIKKGNQKSLAGVKHIDLFGPRQYKYDYLQTKPFYNCPWSTLNLEAPSYFFVPKDFRDIQEYNKGFSLDFAFSVFSQGILSGNDSGIMKSTYDEAQNYVSSLISSNSLEEQTRIMFGNNPAPKHWCLVDAINDLKNGYSIEKIQYRPFDITYSAYTETSCGWLWRPRSEVMNNLKYGFENLCLITTRMIQKGSEFHHIFVSDCITDKGMLSSKDNSYSMPLYTFEENMGILCRKTNFSKDFIELFSQKIGLNWNDEETRENSINSQEVFSYIYAYLHSPFYRNKYRQLLTSEFSKVPYPDSIEKFRYISKMGWELINNHLLRTNKRFTDIEFCGSNRVIEKIVFSKAGLFINKESYFSGMAEDCFDFYVGSYQPLQKWLKDRKGMALTNDDINHYKQMIVAIQRTIEIMDEIDRVIKL